MGKLDGKVAFITGAARGMGRASAVRLAEEGADIIALDLFQAIDSLEYPLSTPDDMAATVKLVEEADRRITAREGDVRDRQAVKRVLDEGLAEFGHVDIVLANAGIAPITGEPSRGDPAWHDAIGVVLTGVFHTIDTALPAMLEHGQGGSIVITSSTAGLKGITTTVDVCTAGILGYTAAKHGVVGLMRAYANALASHNIRVNTVHPTGVGTPMLINEAFGAHAAAYPELGRALQNALPVELMEPVDVANAIAWLCSDEARYVTGVTLPVDAGFTNR